MFSSTPSLFLKGFKFPTLLLLFGLALLPTVAQANEPALIPFAEPSNQPTNFDANVNSSSQITLTWTDSAGAVLPDGYLVGCSETGFLGLPSDGNPIANDTDCGDGFGVQNVPSGVQTAVWSGLDANTEYDFIIFAFTGSGATIDYLVPNPPQVSATTDPIAPVTGTIVIIEDTVPNDPQNFAFSIDGGLLPASFNLDDDGNNGNALSNTRTYANVIAGDYEVEQAANAGYTTSISCVDPSGGTTTNGLTAEIDLAAGETVTCTFTNTEIVIPTGTIVIIEDTVPNDPQNFAFSIDGGLLPANFNLDDDGNNGNALSNTRTYANVVAGDYEVVQTANAGYTTSISCVDPSGGTTTNGLTAEIDLAAGETVTCTFTNTEIVIPTGTITIIENTVPNGPQNFAFSTMGGLVPANFSLDDDANPNLSNSRTFANVEIGDYKVSQAAVAGYDTTVSCVDPSGGTVTGNLTAEINLAANETVTCTFTNERDLPEITVSDPQVVEGDAGQKNLIFQITRSHNVFATSVTANTANDTAVAGSDYVAAVNQSVNFPAGGALTQNVIVKINGDEVVEANETVKLILSNVTNGQFGDNTGIGTIVNDDSATVTLSGLTTVQEGDSGKTTYIYQATLDNDVQGGFKLSKNTTSGTAKAGATRDFDDNDGTLTFAGTAGEVKEIVLKVNGELLVEADEFLTVKIETFSNTNAAASLSVANSPMVVTIENDDTATISLVESVAGNEGDAGTTDFVFTAKLDNPVDGSFKVAYATASGTAVGGDDFVSKSGTLTFGGSAGETETITIKVNGDELVEALETFTVELGAITNSSLVDSLSVGDGIKTGSIVNDDVATVTLTAGPAQAEGQSGTVSHTFTAVLDADVDGGFKVNYATADGTATLADNDYVAKTGMLTFAGSKGESKTITVLSNGDTKGEGDEAFDVLFESILPDKAGVEVQSAGSPQQGTILNDDDSIPLIKIEGAPLMVGESAGSLVVTVSLANPSAQTVTVQLQSADGTATAGADYTAVFEKLTFAPSETSKTVAVTILPDDFFEGDEVFKLELTNPVNGQVGLEPSETVTIKEDDTALGIVLFAPELDEPQSGGQAVMNFEVVLNEIFLQDVYIEYTTKDGSATAGQDYIASSGILEIRAGSTRGVIGITVLGDVIEEPNETFSVVLLGTSSGQLDPSAAAGVAGVIKNTKITIYLPFVIR